MADEINRVPIPKGGFKTNEEEARWLEQTICLRTNEGLAAAGINANFIPKRLYELLLLSLDAASKRGARQAMTLLAEEQTS